MNFKIILYSLLITSVILPNILFCQTQAEIEQMVNGNEEPTKVKKTKKKKLKTELSKRSKKIDKAEKERKIAQKEASKKEALAQKELDKKNAKTKAEKNILVDKQTVDTTNNNTKADPNQSAFANLNFFQTVKIGDKLSQKGSYFNALAYYNDALLKAKDDNKKVDIYTKIADANFFLRDYKQANINYVKAIELNTNTKQYPLLDYQLANTYKYLGEYDSSIVVYKRFLNREKENKNLTVPLRKARKEIKGSEYALAYVNENPKYKIENIGDNVNSSFSDYGPEIVGNNLYFSKINTDKVVVLDEEIKDKEFSKIYYSEIHQDKFGLFQDFAENINTENTHVGNPSFTKDGNTVYFTKCTLSKEMESVCFIYVSVRENNVWSKAVSLNRNINLENTSSTQPQIVALENGEQLLYFVSNRENGKGAKDIWYVNIDEDENFSTAKNAGYPINTSGNDISPFYSPETKTLYFSSDGHINFGGLDVFKISKDIEGEWEEDGVTNLGLPVNSSLDDFDFVLNKNGNAGFLASNRVGTTTLKSATCCDDIFAVKPTAIDIFITGKVFVENETSRNLLEDADLFLYNATTNEQISTIDYKNGIAYLTQVDQDAFYKIVAISDKFKDGEISFNTENIFKSDTFQYDLFLKNKDLTGLVLSTVYYEFDISKLRSDAPDSLRKVVTFLKAYPNVILEVGSHTDSKGTEEYNLALSERRSLSVKNYLIYQKDISEKRLVNKSYGESSPAAPNNSPDGKDNPEGRDLNRRTEFKIIGYLNKDEPIEIK